MNVRKLRKLQKWILAEPKRFDMKTWVSHQLAIERRPPCGTVGCLAGMALHMEGRNINNLSFMYFEPAARKVLDLKVEEAERLFFLLSMHTVENHWPKKFDRAYTRAKTLLGRAKIASRRIDHFIKTKGLE